MNTHTVSPLFSFPQPIVRGHDSNHHAKDKRLEGEKHKNRLADDSYHPNKRLETANSKEVTSKMSLQAVSTSISHSADIQITTKEGDVITINLNESKSSRRGVLQAEQGSDYIAVYSKNNSSESSFNISIEGDLNEGEQKSLADLINKMSKVSDDFFKGNVKSAFKHAQKVGFDTEQIAGFSMELRKEQSVRAVTAYQQTAMLGQNINPDLLKQAGNFIAETKALMADTEAMLDSFSQPQQAFSDLFSGILQMNIDSDLDNEDEQPLFLKMIENIGNDIFIMPQQIQTTKARHFIPI